MKSIPCNDETTMIGLILRRGSASTTQFKIL